MCVGLLDNHSSSFNVDFRIGKEREIIISIGNIKVLYSFALTTLGIPCLCV